ARRRVHHGAQDRRDRLEAVEDRDPDRLADRGGGGRCGVVEADEDVAGVRAARRRIQRVGKGIGRAVGQASRAARVRVAGLGETEIRAFAVDGGVRSEEHTSELQSLAYLVCRLLLEKKNKKTTS